MASEYKSSKKWTIVKNWNTEQDIDIIRFYTFYSKHFSVLYLFNDMKRTLFTIT